MGRPLDEKGIADEALIDRVARADADALGELYDRYGRLVFSIAFHIVGDQATAEEISLDVFTRAWERADSYRPARGKVSTWLITIARRQAIDVLRRHSSRPHQRSLSWDELPAGTAAKLLAGSPEEQPEEATALILQRERVRAAVAQLPAEQRQALAMAYFHGYTHRQIAEVLDQPPGTVKTRIRLAIMKLRRMLINEQSPPEQSGSAPNAYTISEDSD